MTTTVKLTKNYNSNITSTCSIKYESIHHHAAKKIQQWFRNKLAAADPQVMKESQSLMRLTKYQVAAPQRSELFARITNARWKKLIHFTKKLKKDHFVFAHCSSFGSSIIPDLQTHLHRSLFPSYSSRWSTQRKLRSWNTPKTFENTEDYFKSNLCYNINNDHDIDHFPNNIQILSVDGYLNNRNDAESAYDFLKRNRSVSLIGNTGRPNFKCFLGNYIENDNILNFGHYTYQKLHNLFMQTKPGQGVVYLITIPKKTLENQKTCYVWRSHPFGSVCHCYGREDHKKFLSILKQHQRNYLSRLCPANLNPQYRILAPNLDRDPTKKIFVLNSLSTAQEKYYRAAFWDFATLLKQCQRLESISLTTPRKTLVSILLRTRFNIDHTKPRISKLLEELYKKGIKEILVSKELVFKSRSKYLRKQLPKEVLENYEKMGIHF